MTVRNMNADDRELFQRYLAADQERVGGPIGEIFADGECRELVPDWRAVARQVLGEDG